MKAAMTDKKLSMKDLINLELVRRGHLERLAELSDDALVSPEVQQLSLADQVATIRVGIPGTSSAKRGSGTRQNVLAAMRNRSGITVREAVLKACSDAPLTSAEIIDALAELRPDTPTPTTRAEIKRLESAGSLVHTGPQIGGRYRTIPSLRG
jgi:hypothetical protein